MALKHQVTFKNIFGDEITRDIYFNLTKAELKELDLQYEDDGGFDGRVKRLGTSGANEKLILETLKNILGHAYGERQGDVLEKDDRIRSRFFASEEYSIVLEDLAAGKMNPYEFISKILPENNTVSDPNQANKSASDIAREASEARLQGHKPKAQPTPEPEVVQLDAAPPILEVQTPEEPKEPTQEELMELWKKSNNLG